MKSCSFIPLLTSMTLLLAACGPGVTPSLPIVSTATASSSPTVLLPSETPTQTLPPPITVTDALGRTLTFTQLPSRIALTGTATTLVADALYLFPQAAERIAALSIKGQGADFLPLLDPNLEPKLTLDRDAGPEQIAAAQPDLVILKSYLAESLGAPLEALGIPVFYVTLETPDTYLNEIEALGQIFGDEDRAQRIVDYYQQRIRRVEEVTSGLSDDQKPSVLLMQHSAKGGATAYKVAPASWIQTMLVEMAGGRPVWLEAPLGANEWTVITLEQVAVWNPDQIYIIDYFEDPGKAVEALRSDPLTQNLKAVQTHQVFAFPKDTVSWDQPDTRWILGLIWLAAHVQPQQFADLDILQEHVLFYRTLYGLDDLTIQTSLQPLLQGTLP